MTTKLMINCVTNEAELVPLTEEELAQRQLDAEHHANLMAQIQSEKEAKENAKASAIAKLAALGLTEDEVRILVS